MSNVTLGALPTLLHGALATIGISAVSMCIAVMVGLIIGVLRILGGRVLNALLIVFVEVFRGIPLLVLMFFSFFGLPQLGIQINGNNAAILALGVWGAANASEIVRGAIISISHGQTEAALSIGLGRLPTLVFVVFPQAARRMVAPFMSLFTAVVVSSSLAALISVLDLVERGRVYVERFPPVALPVYLTVMVIYFLINYPISIAAGKLERRLV
ncbi:MAG: amino acid ABC transporter permease [Vulcanimicrobiaceae bacterium]